MSSFAYTTPFPPRPKTSFTHVVYLYNDVHLTKGHFGSRGGKHSKNKLKKHQFHLFNDKHHNFKYISYACAEGKLQSFGNEGHLYSSNLVLLLFENL